MKKILPAFLSCQGARLSDDEKRLFERYNPLGVCLFSKICANVESAEQIRALVNDIKQAVGRDNVLIAIDQEGGRVRRLTEPEFTPVTSQQDITTVEQAQQHTYLISHDLKKCDINVNFAPVLDTPYEQTSKALLSRCFKENIATLGKAMVDEYIKNGICPCIKHLPGHGRGVADPHLELPVITENLSELQADFAPFKALNKTPMGMVAHIVLSAVDPDYAASISPKIINEIIRGQIGFTGFLVSDAIMMQALHGTIGERSEAVIKAGCDAVCLGNADFAANEAVCQSKIELTDEAEQRLEPIWQIVCKDDDFKQYEHIKNKYCTAFKNIISYNYQYDATEVLNRLRKA